MSRFAFCRTLWLLVFTWVGAVGAVSQAEAALPTIAACKGPLEPTVVGGCALDVAGCCDPQGRLLYCSGKDLYCIDCAGSFPTCGWAPLGPGATSGSYDCGTNGGADPSGLHPKACESCSSTCVAGSACSPACPGSCGQCSQPGAICLADGSCYTPQCQGKECGLDPKGFPCGSCGPGTACEPALQKCLPIPAACQGSKTPGCQGCGCEKCVCTKHPFCCSVAWDAFCAGACESECGYSCKPCPAKPSCDGLKCGEFCGLQCGSCAQGEVCHKYQCCKPACTGKVCGDDGCGGSCGSCSGTDECVGGNCVKCQPKCAGKSCGDDGCGGSCGACSGTDVCVAGQCVKSLCEGQCGGGPLKGPDGKECFCDDACKDYGDCCANACAVCPDLKNCCQPVCDNKKCGDDGCGGSCGTCPSGEKCSQGQCAPCTADCKGKSCGDDGCGGSCGACSGAAVCLAGECTASVCAGQCGKGPLKTPEGKDCYCDDQCVAQGDCCAGACGACPALKGCCEPACSGKDCGDDGCGGSCGSCAVGVACELGKCAACKPQCSGKNCGPDGCGGSCGSCPSGQACSGGVCACPPSGATTCCGNSVCGIDSCGQVTAPLYACSGKCVDGACASACQPSCIGKACGGDGCGGVCGTCPAGYDCSGGSCSKTLDAGGAGDVAPAPPSQAASDGGCSAAPASPAGGAAAIAAAALLVLAVRRRGRKWAGALALLAVVACGKATPADDAQGSGTPPDNTLDVDGDADGAGGVDAPDNTLDADGAGGVDAPDNTLDADGAGDVDAPDNTLDADGAGDVDAPDNTLDADIATDVAGPATLTYDCANLPQGPFALEAVPGAIASEDLAFDDQGNLVGSNNKAIFKTKFGAKGKVWIPGVEQRAGMRFLPGGKLAVCDDKLGRILLFDPDGSQSVLVQGLSYPNGITTDLKGFIYVTEHDGNRVLRIHPYTGAYTVLTKEIKNPNGIIFDPSFSHLYIGSFATGSIYRLAVSPQGIPGKLVTWASPIGPGGLLDGIGVDACGNVYVCEYGATDIWRIPPSGGPPVKIIDGNGDQTYLPNLQWGTGNGWDPLSIYIPDGWKIGVWRVQLGVPGAPRPFP